MPTASAFFLQNVKLMDWHMGHGNQSIEEERLGPRERTGLGAGGGERSQEGGMSRRAHPPCKRTGEHQGRERVPTSLWTPEYNQGKTVWWNQSVLVQ